MALTKTKINLGTEGNLSGSRSLLGIENTLVSSSAQLATSISGSFTAASSSFSTRVARNEASASSLTTASSSFSTRMDNSEASGALMNQDLKTSASPTFADGTYTSNLGVSGSLTVKGMVTAEEFHTEFVSASIVYTSGSTKFGDDIDDIHSFTGSIHQSGSFNLNDGNMSVTDTLTATNITGTTIKDFTTISGSSTSTGSFGSVHTAGNVGIGTTSPDGDLDVRGALGYVFHTSNLASGTNNLIFRSGSTAESWTGQIEFHGSAYGNSQIVTRNTSNLRLGTNNTAAMTISGSNQYVGIGTTTPSSSLDVSVGGTDYITITNDGEMIGRIGDLHGSNKIGVLELFSDQVKSTRLVGDTGDNFFLGNVGIGDTTPQSLLDIGGATHDYGALSVNATGSRSIAVFQTGDTQTFTGASLATAAQGESGIILRNHQDTDNNFSYVSFMDAGGFTNSMIMSRNVDHDGSGGGDLLFLVREDDSGADTLNKIPLVLKNNGNVGIGTTGPGAQLHIGSAEATPGGTAGTVDRLYIQPYSNTGGPYKFKARTVSGASDYLDLYYGSNHIISWDLNGKVGIGTTGPPNPLTVAFTQDSSETDITQDVDKWGCLVSSAYESGTYVGLVGNYTTDNSATKPKTGIWAENTNSGTKLHLGTSSNYSAGVNVRNLTLMWNDDVKVNTGNLVIGTAGKGIDFDGNSRTAVLDDYEEGTWSGIFYTSGGALSMGSNTGTFIRIGSVVYCCGYFACNGLNGKTGAVKLHGLPYDIPDATRRYSSACIGYGSNVNITAQDSLTGYGIPDSDSIQLCIWNSSVGTNGLDASQLSADGSIMVSFTYSVY